MNELIFALTERNTGPLIEPEINHTAMIKSFTSKEAVISVQADRGKIESNFATK